MPRYLAAAILPVVTAIAWVHAFGGYTAWVHPMHIAVSGALVASALLTAWAVWRGQGRLSHAIAAGMLAMYGVLVVLTIAGIDVVGVDLYPDKRVAFVIVACCVLAVYGLVRRRVWGRWFALALGAAAVASGAFNERHFWSIAPLDGTAPADWLFETAWMMLASVLGGLAIVVALATPAARDACSTGAAWTGDARLARLVRPMLLTAFAAVPMLLVYAWLQPVVPATQTTAIVLAAVLAAGAALAVRGKLAGALVLVVAGLGMFAQTAATYFGAAPAYREVALYYVVFWLPAAVFALVCGIRLARPVWRLLRGITGA